MRSEESVIAMLRQQRCPPAWKPGVLSETAKLAGQPVPLLDLKPQYESLQNELNEAVLRVVQSQHFILGPEVDAMEAEIAEYCGCKYCIGVSSGSDALLLSLMALGIGPGDEVLVPSFTFFATAGAVTRLGATPVFVDSEPDTYNIAVDALEERITPHTKAIIPVHLFGQMADMQPIMEIAEKYGLYVIEDAAQAIGAEYEGKRAGSMGITGCFSFFPSKNLGAFGDAGAITTNDDELYEKMVTMRVHGGKPKYYYRMIGGNFRIDALQAAVLRVKLAHLDKWTTARQQNALFYNECFAKHGLTADYVKTPRIVQSRHIFNQYTIEVPDRDALRDYLLNRGIGCEIYYPVPLHQQDCFAEPGSKADGLPYSESAAASVLSLPIYPELTQEQLQTVVEAIADHYHAQTSTCRAA